MSSVVVPVTVTATRLVTPSASACICCAKSAQASRTASSNSCWVGVIPDAPDASNNTVSFVEVDPSMSRRSKVTAVACRSAASAMSGVIDASVVRHTSIVASDGAIIPTPFPIPANDQPPACVTRVVFRTVSVVMIASAAASA